MNGFIKDFFGLVGLAMIFVGSWWLAPPWALIAVGTIILLIGITIDTRPNKPVESTEGP